MAAGEERLPGPVALMCVLSGLRIIDYEGDDTRHQKQWIYTYIKS